MAKEMTAAGAPSEQRSPISLGETSPARRFAAGITPLAVADEKGGYQLRAAPGVNIPYFANFHGERMAWNTTEQPAVVVKEGDWGSLGH
jgi:hypothetical protein